MTFLVKHCKNKKKKVTIVKMIHKCFLLAEHDGDMADIEQDTKHWQKAGQHIS